MNRKNLIAAALTTVLTAGPGLAFTNAVLAASDTASVQGAEKAADKTDKAELVRLSEDANLTMRDVRWARLALFDGHTLEAQTYVDAARSRVAAAVDGAADYATNTDGADDEDLLVPFDASVAFAEEFQEKPPAAAAATAAPATDGDSAAPVADTAPPPDNHGPLAQANRHLKAGEAAKAMDDLKLASSDILLSASVVPIRLAQARIDEAASLMKDGKYYQAGLALKRIEDAVLIDTVVLAAPTKQGDDEAAS